MSQATMEQLQQSHDRHTERNRQLPVQDYKSKSPQIDKVFEVTEGVKYVPGENGTQVALGPGRRFRPTEQAIRTGALRGKARELTASELNGVRGGKSFAGADIGVRADLATIPMADSTRERAVKCGLIAADFLGTEPNGADGVYTRAQIDDLSAAKQKANKASA